MKKIKVICFSILVFSMLFLTGCWNYREVDTLGIVAGLAIDKGEQGSKYHVTFEVLDLSGGSKSPAKPKLLETEGDTVFDAVRNAIKISDKKLFFSDCKLVILSSDLAADGIQPVLDWFARDTEPRLTLNLIISKEKTAAEILSLQNSGDDIASFKIADMIDHNMSFLGQSPKVELYQAYNKLEGKGVSLVLPSVKVDTEKSGKFLNLAGTSVFKKDKLLGFLDNGDSKFFLFATGKVKGGLFLTKVDSSDTNVSLEISGSETKITPVLSNGKLSMKIDITLKAAMGEDNTGGGKLPENAIEVIQKSAEKQLVEGVSGIIKRVQKEYDSDIFGFGTLVYQTDPNFWKEIEPEWDKIFASLKCDVTAKVEIENTATAKIKEKGSE